jgi:hypothetical protein
MNKIYIPTLLLVFVLLFSACQASTETDTPPIATAETPELPRTIAILVVDAFAMPEESSIDTSDSTTGENCLITPDGQGTYVSHGAAATILGIPHGLAVFNEIDNYISLAAQWNFVGKYLAQDINPQPGYIAQLNHYDDAQSNQHLLVVGVDTLGYATGVVADSIEKTIALLQSGLEVGKDTILQADGFIINMSLASFLVISNASGRKMNMKH